MKQVTARLVTVDEVAAMLRLSRRTLRSWRQKGIGPAYLRLGRRVVYRVEDLSAFVEAQRVTPGGIPARERHQIVLGSCDQPEGS